MGLSDGERYCNTVYCISELSKIDKFTNSYLKNFNTILKSLWRKFLAESCNDTYWLFGSASNSDYIDEGLFAIAMKNAYSELDLGKKEEDLFVSDPHQPNAINSLEKFNKEKANIFKIFRLTESYFYSANRYKDKFSKSLKPLTDKICDLQSLCYEQFSKDKDYLKAWMTEVIFYKIFVDNDEDCVKKIFKKNGFYNYIRIDKINDLFIWKTFKRYQRINDKDRSSMDRLMVVLEFVKKAFYYDYMHTEMFELIESHNENNSDDKIDLETVKKFCAKIISDYNKKEDSKNRKSRKSKRYCNLTDQFV